jgi:hypothetical protein
MHYVLLPFIWSKLLFPILDILFPCAPSWKLTDIPVTLIKDISLCCKTIDTDHHTI